MTNEYTTVITLNNKDTPKILRITFRVAQQEISTKDIMIINELRDEEDFFIKLHGWLKENHPDLAEFLIRDQLLIHSLYNAVNAICLTAENARLKKELQDLISNRLNNRTHPAAMQDQERAGLVNNGFHPPTTQNDLLIATLQTKNKELTEKVADLIKQLEAVRQSNAAEIQTLEENLAEAKKSTSLLEAKLQTIQTELAEQKNNIKKMRAWYKEQIKQANNQTSRIQNDNQKYQQEHDELFESLKKLRAKTDTLQADLANSQQKLMDSEKKLDNQIKENLSLNQTIVQLKQSLSSNTQALQAEIDRLNQQLSAIMSELANVQSQNRKLEAELRTALDENKKFAPKIPASPPSFFGASSTAQLIEMLKRLDEKKPPPPNP